MTSHKSHLTNSFWFTITKSLSSKLISSRVILLRPIKAYIIAKENQKSKSPKTILSLENTAPSRFCIILLAAKQSGIDFNACISESTVLSHIFKSHI